MTTDAAVIAANRLGLGARPGDLATISTDPRGWVLSQLHGGAPQLNGSELQSSQQIINGAAPILRQRREARLARANDSAGAADAGAEAAQVAMRLPQYLRPIYQADTRARLQAAIVSERPFVERLVYFWSNHFAVSVDKQTVLGIAGSFEREAIRTHVLGNFRDMLLAVETHPAMLLYLDNQQSVGPNSQLARRAAGRGRTLGLNENLAREILELHTLGVDAGYTQADVTSFAKVLTGWSLGGGEGPLARGAPGEFIFRPNLHEPDAQQVFGKRYAQSDQAQGIAVLSDLAVAPATARHVATKLARHFIADEPPREAVERIARAFERSGGDLPTVYAAIVNSSEVWEGVAVKFKTPQDYLFSLCRGLTLPQQAQPRVLAAFELLGQRQFAPRSPAGWPDRSADWDGASALMHRIEFSDAIGQQFADQRDAAQLAPQLLGGQLSVATREAIAHAATPAQALTLLFAAPEFMRR